MERIDKKEWRERNKTVGTERCENIDTLYIKQSFNISEEIRKSKFT
jgi:hypothetical protein